MASTKPSPRHWRNRITGQEDVDPESLLANPMNWRVHPRFQQEAVESALDEIGWIQRVVVNTTTGHVVDGHLRVAVAISRGEKSVPVTYVQLGPDEERLALATFDPLGALAVADDHILQELLKDVRPYVADEHLTKLLSDLARGDLLPIGGEPDLDGLVGEDKAPQPGLTQGDGEGLDGIGQEIEQQEPHVLEELQKRWGTAAGQTWAIPSGKTPGKEHVLKIGSATDELALGPIASYLGHGSVIVTSPPYGMGQAYEAGFEGNKPPPKRTRKADRGSPDRLGGRPTEAGVGAWLELIDGFTRIWSERVSAACINLADHTVSPIPGFARHTYGDLVSMCEQYEWRLAATRIWHKGPVWGNNAYWLASYKPVPEYEYVGLFMRPGAFPYKAVSERVPQSEDWRFRSMWEFPSVQSQQMDKGFHPAAFPVELPRRCILLLTDAGGTVVDPFLGSGTTLVASEALGRLCVGVEQDPTFAAMALERATRLGLSPRCLNKND